MIIKSKLFFILKRVLSSLNPSYLYQFFLNLTFLFTITVHASEQALLEQVYQNLATAKPIDSSNIEKTFFNSDLIDSKMKLYAHFMNPSLQNLIDHSFINITKTNFGTNICLMTTTIPEQLVQHLGVSLSAAHTISQTCEKNAPELKRREIWQNFKIGIKKYYFVFNVPIDFPFHSWTSMINETFIFFNSKLTLEEIQARLIHEYFITNDAKLQLNSEMGLDLENLYETKIYNAGFDKNREMNIKNIFGIMPFPLIRFSLASLRAMEAERLIINELYPNAIKSNKLENAEILNLLEQRNQTKALSLVLSTLAPLQDYLLPVEYSLVPRHERKWLAPHLYTDEKSVNRIVDIFNESNLKFRSIHGGPTLSLIEWSTRPMLGAHGTFYSRGPRPRVGGGWSENKVDIVNENRVDILKKFSQIKSE